MRFPDLKTRDSVISILVILISFVICASVFHPYPYDNVVTRWALAERLLESGSLDIDPWSGMTGDRAYYQGHNYSDKSFLPSAAAAIASFPVFVLAGLDGPDCYPVGGIGRYVAERITVSLALVLLLLLLRKRCVEDGMDTTLPVISLGLGSILLPYSSLLYTHVPAAMLLFACYSTGKDGKHLASEVLGALAVAFEYTLLLPVAIIMAFRPREYWNPFRLLRPFVILLLAITPQLVHNWAALGSPFSTGYGLEAHGAFPVVSRGFFGFTYPSPARLYMMLISPERGIFFFMPWTFFGLWGLLEGKDWRNRLLHDPLPAAVLAYLLLYSAQNASTAGWAYGQRYLIPIVPFMAAGLGKFASRSSARRAMAAAAVLPGIIIALAGTFGEIHLPVHPVGNPIPLPSYTISLKMLLDGHHSMWLTGAAGTIVLATSALGIWFYAAVRSRLRLFSFIWLPAWLLLALLSLSEDWGGRIDYYRGVLAEHRREWTLAEGYYMSALEDESAPDIIESRLEYVRLRAETD